MRLPAAPPARRDVIGDILQDHGPFGEALAGIATPDAYKATVLTTIGTRFDPVADALDTRPYLTGDAFTIADAYLFTIVDWQRFLAFDIDRWPAAAIPGARGCAACGEARARGRAFGEGGVTFCNEISAW